MIPKKTCTPAITPASQNHPFLTAHKGRRPALWGGLWHWQRHDWDTFGQSLTALPGSVKRLWLAQKHPALATCNAHLSGLQSTLITLTHLAEPDTAHTSFACTVNTVGSVYYRQSHNPLDGWPQKERQADITFYATNIYTGITISQGVSTDKLWELKRSPPWEALLKTCPTVCFKDSNCKAEWWKQAKLYNVS